MAEQNTLSREVLKWIQSLDLAYSVKNVKRDFSNGFLIAEIFSRYYDREIQMHSFDNGAGIAVKKDNWHQLCKFFKKFDVPYEQVAIENLIHSKTGAAVKFINHCYEYLTKRKVQDLPNPPAQSRMPAFAKPTASQVIKNTTKQPEMAEVTDDAQTAALLAGAMQSHEDSMQADRSADPSRYQPGASHRKVLRGATRTVGAEDSQVQITFKQVNVKPIDHNVMQMRASKEMSARGGDGGSVHESAVQSGRPTATAAELLNQCVEAGYAAVGEESRNQREASAEFVERLSAGADEAVVAAVFSEVATSAAVLADACLVQPREFMRVIELCFTALRSCADGSSAENAVVDALSVLGDRMVAKDAATTWMLFQEYGMGHVAQILTSAPSKRMACCHALYAYAEDNVGAHTQVLKQLKEALPDELGVYVHALTVLIFLERELDDNLLDVYAYYCAIGMAMPSPTLRASSIAMLASITARNLDFVFAPSDENATTGLFDKMEAMAEDMWWEVHAQTLVVCSALLRHLGDSGPRVDRVLALIDLLFHADASPNVQKVGLSHLAKNLTDHPRLLDVYLDVLLALPSSARIPLLSSAGSPGDNLLPVAGKIKLTPLPMDWPALTVARALVNALASDNADRLREEHAQTLLACVRSGATGNPFGEDMSAWTAIFRDVQDYIFVALCDSACCEMALLILREFTFYSSLSSNILEIPTFRGTLRLLFPEEDAGRVSATCQRSVCDFLLEVAAEGGEHRDVVRAALDEFVTKFPQQLSRWPVLSAVQEQVASGV